MTEAWRIWEIINGHPTLIARLESEVSCLKMELAYAERWVAEQRSAAATQKPPKDIQG